MLWHNTVQFFHAGRYLFLVIRYRKEFPNRQKNQCTKYNWKSNTEYHNKRIECSSRVACKAGKYWRKTGNCVSTRLSVDCWNNWNYWTNYSYDYDDNMNHFVRNLNVRLNLLAWIGNQTVQNTTRMRKIHTMLIDVNTKWYTIPVMDSDKAFSSQLKS